MTSAAQRESGRGVAWLHLASAVFVALWLSVGMASSLVTAVPSTVKIAVLAGWVLVATGRSAPFVSAMVINAWPLAVMLLISVLFAAEVTQSDQYIQGLGYLLIAFALLCFYSQPPFRRERDLLMGVMTVDLVITGVRTFVALQTDPQLSRYLATTEENRTAVYGSQSFAGLGGYGYAYSLAAMLLVLLYFATKSRRGRTPLLLASAMGFVVLFELQFTTAIVLALALGAFFLVRDLVGRRELRVLVYAAVLLGWMAGLYSAILDGLARQSWVGDEVSERLGELSRFLSGEATSGGDLANRLGLWSHSIDTLLASGPLGLAGQGAASQETGGHSQWLDVLASYGLFALFLALFLVFAWRLCVSRAARDKEPIKRVWTYFLVLGLFNPLLFSTIVLTWMFFLPALIGWIGDRSASRQSEASNGVAA